MPTEVVIQPPAPYVSIGIFAWNEESAISAALNSLFRQSLFGALRRHRLTCEVICVLNGCTDRTPIIATEVLKKHERQHIHAQTFSARVANLRERGKLNAWNQFVHALSARGAQFLLMMDADILIHRPDTLWNMILALEQDAAANASVDRPCKHLLFKRLKTPRERLSLAMAEMTHSAPAQLCAQLYCLRAAVARNIYMPKGLTACEDGFIKTLVCTDFLIRPVMPQRIRVAKDAGHTFEAYTSPAAVLRNQKRQIIGQTMVHVLVDGHLKSWPPAQRLRLAEVLREKETDDPNWLRRLLDAHLQRVRFAWRLYPGLLSERFRHWRQLPPLKRLLCFPAAAAGTLMTFLASFMAYRFLKAGSTDYWPQAKRAGFAGLEALRSLPLGLATNRESRN